MKCPKCGKEHTIDKEQEQYRKMIFSPKIRLIPYMPAIINPLYNQLPPKEQNPEQWCGDCIRIHLHYDEIDMMRTISTGEIIYKEKKQ